MRYHLTRSSKIEESRFKVSCFQKCSQPDTGLWNRGTLVLNDTKLVLVESELVVTPLII